MKPTATAFQFLFPFIWLLGNEEGCFLPFTKTNCWFFPLMIWWSDPYPNLNVSPLKYVFHKVLWEKFDSPVSTKPFLFWDILDLICAFCSYLPSFALCSRYGPIFWPTPYCNWTLYHWFLCTNFRFLFHVFVGVFISFGWYFWTHWFVTHMNWRQFIVKFVRFFIVFNFLDVWAVKFFVFPILTPTSFFLFAASLSLNWTPFNVWVHSIDH